MENNDNNSSEKYLYENAKGTGVLASVLFTLLTLILMFVIFIILK